LQFKKSAAENDKLIIKESTWKFIPAEGDHGLWPWRNVQSCYRDVAPHGRDAGDHVLCPWGSIKGKHHPAIGGMSGKLP